MTFCTGGGVKPGRQEKDQGLPGVGVGEGGMSRQTREEIYSHEITLCDTLMGTRVRICAQRTECTMPSGNPNLNCGVWVTLLFHW